MQYTAAYQSSVGDVLLAADETGLTGLWFEGEKFYASVLILSMRKGKRRFS